LECYNGHVFRFEDNIIDFSAPNTVTPLQQRTNTSFGVEWSEYYPRLGWAPSEQGCEIDNFLILTKAMPNFFSAKVVIDAGCGNGRYIKVVNTISTPRPRLVIGVELSDSIIVASRNCAVYDNVVFIRMDLNALPAVIKDPVDYVYSIGVLHHTPNAEQGFYNLARCVRDGGFLSLFLYGKGNPVLYRVNCFLRNRFFRSWRHKFVFWLCVLTAIPGQLFRVKWIGPWVGDFVNRFVFVSSDVHNMFDAYTAGYTSFHERGEVERWYRSVGFDVAVEERINRTSLHCIGRKVAVG